jgi:hypothetical protein
MRNNTVTPDSDPGSSLDSRLRGNDAETPITVRLQDSLYFTAKGTLSLANAISFPSLGLFFRLTEISDLNPVALIRLKVCISRINLCTTIGN